MELEQPHQQHQHRQQVVELSAAIIFFFLVNDKIARPENDTYIFNAWNKTAGVLRQRASEQLSLLSLNCAFRVKWYVRVCLYAGWTMMVEISHKVHVNRSGITGNPPTIWSCARAHCTTYSRERDLTTKKNMCRFSLTSLCVVLELMFETLFRCVEKFTLVYRSTIENQVILFWSDKKTPFEMFHKQKTEWIGRCWSNCGDHNKNPVNQYEQLRFYPMRKNNPYYKLIAVLEFIPLFNL